jgi:hypothetical protein
MELNVNTENLFLYISLCYITKKNIKHFSVLIYSYGASVAKWLAHLPFTSEAAGSSLSENFLNATRTQSSSEKSKKSTLCRKSWVFPRCSGFLPQGKLTGWVR